MMTFRNFIERHDLARNFAGVVTVVGVLWLLPVFGSLKGLVAMLLLTIVAGLALWLWGKNLSLRWELNLARMDEGKIKSLLMQVLDLSLGLGHTAVNTRPLVKRLSELEAQLSDGLQGHVLLDASFLGQAEALVSEAGNFLTRYRVQREEVERLQGIYRAASAVVDEAVEAAEEAHEANLRRIQESGKPAIQSAYADLRAAQVALDTFGEGDPVELF